MKAETAYNVIQALPEEEKNRLYSMLGFQVISKEKKPNETKFLTKEEYTDLILKQLNNNKKIKLGIKMKVV